MSLNACAFPEFFAAMWSGRSLFPWQRMLVERAAQGDWPRVINLPTASGKTACMDAALFALAITADQSDVSKRMPRRIWLVVDRRLVVDDAFERAKAIAMQLQRARADKDTGILGAVADKLCALSGTERPLAVARLRGGAWRDDGWARVPTQPAVICSTVDQVGSSLLFRAYGHGERTVSIYAGLAAHDSLIILDEAHCSVPFYQTLRAVEKFRGDRWAEQPIKTPFRFAIMSATLPNEILEERVFPKRNEREIALDHELLRQRSSARKVAELVLKKNSQFETEAVTRAQELARTGGKRRIAVMVNRVATADAIANELAAGLGDEADVVLLTGRMRPLDRDELVGRWSQWLKAGSSEIPLKPIVVISTQCLEVGADFSFDALVTECASLDALRQRFGRLDRLGTLGESPAVILVREHDTKEPKPTDEDPVYGRAIYETWKWLNDPEQRQRDGKVDFGIMAMDARVIRLRQMPDGRQRFEDLLAKSRDAPVLLPAHLDLLCQTSPRPTPEPDVSLFLHGKGDSAPEVRVVLRADISEQLSEEQLKDLLSLLPPTSPEMLTVPLYRLRRWLSSTDIAADDTADVQGAAAPPAEDGEARTRARSSFMLWRGSEKSRLSWNTGDIRPNDVVVLPARLGLAGLGQTVPQPTGVGDGGLDLAERALRSARGITALRLQVALLAKWLPPLLAKDLVQPPPGDEREQSRQFVESWLALLHGETLDTAQSLAPDWLIETIQTILDDEFTAEQHPGGGLILIAKKRRRPDEREEDDLQSDEEDLTSENREEISLLQHTSDVRRTVAKFATNCLSEELVGICLAAADGHDLGKLDWRFQLLLHNGDESAAAAAEEPLAKSPQLPRRRSRRLEIRDDVRLPAGFRHEMFSVQIAGQCGLVPDDLTLGDLVLHLIASHHGYARPFAPVAPDAAVILGQVPEISLHTLGLDFVVTAEDRSKFPPAHRLDSGLAERFWRLTRHFGWWGLAYLETLFRLADWQASRQAGRSNGEGIRPPARVAAPVTLRHFSKLNFDALDGSNPLAFLAALGTLRLATEAFAETDLRLSWSQYGGAWRASVEANTSLDADALLNALQERGLDIGEMFSPALLAATEVASPKNRKGEVSWKDKLMFPIRDFRYFCETAAREPNSALAFIAAWAGETGASAKEGAELARKTRFDFTAGQQAFIRMIRELRTACSKDDLRRSLFDGWHYSSAAVSMRWDPADEKRQYALQAVDPTNGSENPPLADPGANFLAVEALPLFPLVADRAASQPGFDYEGRRPFWRWPIWTVPINLDVIRSLLTLSLGNSLAWPAQQRRELGIVAVYQSAIVQPSGRYRCFTPARSL
jgi:CRISPR-associated endonuclease/helicase Cas3